MPTMTELLARKCHRTETGLAATELPDYLSAVPGWTCADAAITKSFTFKNYYETLSFINAIAYVIHAEDHHPTITLSYQHCQITFTTDSVKDAAAELAKIDGVSLNQFIAAAVAEKVGTLRTASEFLRQRSGTAKPKDLVKFLRRAPKLPPIEGDESV